MYGYIYLTTNKVNGKKYIGQHKGEYDPSYIGSGIKLWEAIKKYGRQNFSSELLFYCNSKEELDEAEIKTIEKFNAIKSNKYYNIAPGGYGGILYERRDGEHNPFFGKNQTDKQKELTSKALKGKKRPPEVIAKWSATQKGKKLTDEHKSNLCKQISLINIKTNEIIKFNSIKELCETLVIPRYHYANARKHNKVISGTNYKLFEEEEKYGRNRTQG
ncbi:MAG TPA: hypothetical protein VK190_04720 [Pseudoneobacillus sp.]|nr:hypothetical protein [Pseudoneobacillus sp.]